MDGQTPAWETSKENVMPARRGRRVADIEKAQDRSTARAKQLADQQACVRRARSPTPTKHDP